MASVRLHLLGCMGAAATGAVHVRADCALAMQLGPRMRALSARSTSRSGCSCCQTGASRRHGDVCAAMLLSSGRQQHRCDVPRHVTASRHGAAVLCRDVHTAVELFALRTSDSCPALCDSVWAKRQHSQAPDMHCMSAYAKACSAVQKPSPRAHLQGCWALDV